MLDSGQRFEDLDLMHFVLEKLDGTHASKVERRILFCFC